MSEKIKKTDQLKQDFFTKPLILEGNLLAMPANKVFAFEANNDYNCFKLW